MSTYKVIELVGSSYVSWTEAAKEAIETASKTLEDMRVAEVTRMDMRLEEGGRFLFRTRLQVSFKVHSLEKFAETLGTKPYSHEEE
jgi:flavin-binding protein dodecin